MSGERVRYWRHPALPAVDLLTARYVTHRFTKHTHDAYAVGVIESGVEEFENAGTHVSAPAGSLVVVNPGVIHTGQAGTTEGWAYRMAYPEPETVAAVATELGAPPGTPYFPDPVVHDQAIVELFRAFHRASEHGDALAATTLMRTAVAGLLRHARHLPPGDGPGDEPRAVRAAREILHESLIDPPSLESLAESVGLRPFALLRAFRSTTGLPPHAYLNQLRVRQARTLLEEGLRPAEVAARSGFADQSHLTRHFKRTVGIPPGAYRRARARPAG
ncbi:AraC family ligand binding domain-containing protein [Spirillospora sp. CA-294931]|uniref:AraC family transcriptional regulator n=1 Tax=Spirillospora sp. CA-294931 TaxID=3240042 RepID=UPI003D8C15F9